MRDITPKHIKKQNPWSKWYPKGKQPYIRGSYLHYTTSTNRSFSEPVKMEDRRAFA